MSFELLGLLPALSVALLRLGLSHPTAIQSAAIPEILANKDLVAKAKTGSGKTLAYGLPVLQKLVSTAGQHVKGPRALVLAPTRELAIQIAESLSQITRSQAVPVKISVLFGGVSINPQMMAMRGGTDLVVATPGRLLELVSKNALDLRNVQCLVLDEADRLLDMGFEEELQQLRLLMASDRQTLCFSATFPTKVEELTKAWMRTPEFIDVASNESASGDIDQQAIRVDPGRRTQLLRHLIQTHHWKRVLVFVATKHAAEMVADKLRKVRIYAEPFHGELSQGKRSQVLSDFKASRLKVVVATDMASRGLDISELPVVINFDLPRSTDDYTHRIGRTGRAGEKGLAVSFVTAATQGHFNLIQKRQGLSLSLEVVKDFEPTEDEIPTTSGGIKGKRPNKKDKLRAMLSMPSNTNAAPLP